MSVRNWLIYWLGGVPSVRYTAAVEGLDVARIQIDRYKSRLCAAIDERAEALKSEKRANDALAAFIDRIQIDPDGLHRPRDIEMPPADLRVDEPIDLTEDVIRITVKPPTIGYSVLKSGRDPEGVFLAKVKIAADQAGLGLAQSIKARFGIAIHEDYGQ